MQNFLLILSNVVLVVIGQVLIKQGVNKIGGFDWSHLDSFLFRSFTAPLIILGLVFYVISAAIWIMILSKMPLSFAYPMLSIGYILILFVSWLFLHETITPLKILGVLLICLGIFFIYKTA